MWEEGRTHKLQFHIEAAWGSSQSEEVGGTLFYIEINLSKEKVGYI